MAEPLVISFAADTSRAQSAMNALAAQVAGNMASVAVAMHGRGREQQQLRVGPRMLATNLSRAASAVSTDVKNISAATVAAATKDKATLEGVVGSFTGAAVSSQTAQATVKAGLTGTTFGPNGSVRPGADPEAPRDRLRSVTRWGSWRSMPFLPRRMRPAHSGVSRQDW